MAHVSEVALTALSVNTHTVTLVQILSPKKAEGHITPKIGTATCKDTANEQRIIYSPSAPPGTPTHPACNFRNYLLW